MTSEFTYSSLHDDSIPLQDIPRNSPHDFTRSGETKYSPKQRNPLLRTGSWLWEIGGTVFSVICMGLLVGFLKYIDGSVYSDWQYSVSPNAIASLIVTIAKGAMLIPVSACLSQLKWNDKQHGNPTSLYRMQVLDQASRGPWGALEVFWRMAPGLATLGAVLMVISVAVDPFAQQILTYPTRQVEARNETAYTYSTHAYIPGWQEPDYNAGVEIYLAGYEAEPTLQVAILNGLAGTYRPLEPVCPSGTCDYDDFVTLGVCSECRDVTQESKQTCGSTGLMTFLQEGDGPTTPFQDKWINSIHSHCTYTSPSGHSITPDLMKPSWDNETAELYRQPWTSTVTSDTDDIRGYQSPLISFFAAKYNASVHYVRDNMTEPEPKPTLSECSVYWCERAYTQNRVTPNQRTLHMTNNQKLYSKGPEIDNAHPAYLVPYDGKQTLSNNSVYRVSMWSIFVIQPLMTSFFNSSLIEANMDLTKLPGVQSALLLWNSKNLSQTMDEMATSVTDNFRTGDNAVQVPGRVFVNETFIHVRWPWIIFPLTVVVLSALLLVATAVASKRLHAVLWKSSLLPLLAGRLETQPGHDLASVADVDDAVDMSKDIKLVMESQSPPVLREPI